MRQLERRSVESFLPLYDSVRRWKDRRIRLQLPVFPGYIFVRLALRDRLRVLEIPSVVRLVGFGGHPTPLPAEEIETIRSCIARHQFLVPSRYVRRGQRVRMSSGPLEGLTGVVVRQKNRTRFVISLELLMRSVAVEIDRADFDPRPNLQI
jgi:transcription antitermination factor NusG